MAGKRRMPATIGMCWTNAAQETVADRIVEHLRSTAGDEPVRYPGERTLALREAHRREGIPVDREAWEFVQNVHRNAGLHRPPSRHGAA